MPGKTKSEVKKEFAGQGYPIHVIGRHIDITDSMKSYAIDKLMKVEHFGGRVLDLTVTMDIQKLVCSVSFIINVNNTMIKVTGYSEDMYAAVDQAIDKLKAKLRHYVDKLHKHHSKNGSVVDLSVNVIPKLSFVDEINDQIEEANLSEIEKELRPHRVVIREKKHLSILNQEEAVMKMELSEDSFLLYRGEDDMKLKVIYRRDDGNYGVIEAE